MNNYNEESSEYRTYVRGPKTTPPFARIASVTHHESTRKEPVPCRIYCNHTRRYESVYQAGTQENPNYANGFY